MSTAGTVEQLAQRAGRAGPCAYGAGVIGLGVVCLFAGSLGAVFQQVPRWLPLGAPLAYASGVVMVAGGLALIARKMVPLAGLVLAVNFAVWLLLLNLPTALANPKVAFYWEACGLNLTMIGGGWIVVASGRSRAGRLFGDRGAGLARRVYAVGLPLVGIAHFANAQAATGYVPTWFPLRIDWVYLTGTGHIAAGLAILVGVMPRLAARLEAAQITAFVIIAHIPAVVSAPGDRSEWAQLIYAVAIAGAAWLVAASYRRA